MLLKALQIRAQRGKGSRVSFGEQFISDDRIEREKTRYGMVTTDQPVPEEGTSPLLLLTCVPADCFQDLIRNCRLALKFVHRPTSSMEAILFQLLLPLLLHSPHATVLPLHHRPTVLCQQRSKITQWQASATSSQPVN